MIVDCAAQAAVKWEANWLQAVYWDGIFIYGAGLPASFIFWQESLSYFGPAINFQSSSEVRVCYLHTLVFSEVLDNEFEGDISKIALFFTQVFIVVSCIWSGTLEPSLFLIICFLIGSKISPVCTQFNLQWIVWFGRGFTSAYHAI